MFATSYCFGFTRYPTYVIPVQIYEGKSLDQESQRYPRDVIAINEWIYGYYKNKNIIDTVSNLQ
jgi:hypothetical protein